MVGLTPQAIPGLALSINNGTSPRNVVVQFSADMRVDGGAEVFLTYSIDGGPATEQFGPYQIAQPGPAQTRSTIAVIPLGTGVHTITPFWQMIGDPFAEADVYNRCFTAEGRTR